MVLPMTLIERIEAASGSDRLLDAELAILFRLGLPVNAKWAHKFPDWAVGRGGQIHILNGAHGTAGHFYAPRYTASTDAAFCLLEGLPRLLCLSDMGDGTWIAKLVRRPARSAANAALAICAAALSEKETSNAS